MSFEPTFLVHVLLPLTLASVVISENLTFLLLGLSFMCNPAYYKAFACDRLRSAFKWAFLLFCFVIALVVINGGLVVGTDPALIIKQNHRLFIILLLAPVIADLTYVSLLQTRIDFSFLYRVFHLGLLALVLIKLAYVLVMNWPLPGVGLEALLGRESGFFSRNPNFFDDYAAILICASAWTTLLVLPGAKTGTRWRFVVPSTAVAVFLFNIIVFSESRAGWIGIVAASGLVFVALILSRKLTAAGLFVLLLVLLSAIHWDRIVPEVTKSLPGSPAVQLQTGDTQDEAPETPQGGLQQQPVGGKDNCKDGSASVEDLVNVGKDRNIGLRLIIYEFAFNAWLQRPVLGYGAYDKYALAEEIPTRDRCAVLYMDHAHNLYLHLAVVGGLVLLLLIVVILCVPLVLFAHAVWRAKQNALLYLPGAAFGVFLLIENLFGLNFANIQFGVVISWLLMTLVSFALVSGTAGRETLSNQ